MDYRQINYGLYNLTLLQIIFSMKKVLVNFLFSFTILVSLLSCSHTDNGAVNEAIQLNALAQQYVRLGLRIGQYDKDFVDAYYGPDSLKPVNPALAIFPKDSFLIEVSRLSNDLTSLNASANDTLANRARWMGAQLKAFECSVKLFGGDSASFEVECKDLYGVTPPSFDSTHFKEIIQTLNDILRSREC